LKGAASVLEDLGTSIKEWASQNKIYKGYEKQVISAW